MIRSIICFTLGPCNFTLKYVNTESWNIFISYRPSCHYRFSPRFQYVYSFSLSMFKLNEGRAFNQIVEGSLPFRSMSCSQRTFVPIVQDLKRRSQYVFRYHLPNLRSYIGITIDVSYVFVAWCGHSSIQYLRGHTIRSCCWTQQTIRNCTNLLHGISTSQILLLFQQP